MEANGNLNLTAGRACMTSKSPNGNDVYRSADFFGRGADFESRAVERRDDVLARSSTNCTFFDRKSRRLTVVLVSPPDTWFGDYFTPHFTRGATSIACRAAYDHSVMQASR
jgi:hypothetical protein